MASQVRVLAESDQKPSLAELRTVLGPQVEVAVQEGDEQDWSLLVLRHKDGQEIALIKRDRVAPGELGAHEIEELVAELDGARPLRNAEWLKHYFSHVKVVYAMRPFSGTEVKDGMSAVLRAQAYFWKKFGGILQADGEGFSNREGYHVLWQFHGPQQGELEAAVMSDDGQWTGFVMDMGDPEQVAAFQRGEVPAGAIRHG
jgi:hypothetical protein